MSSTDEQVQETKEVKETEETVENASNNSSDDNFDLGEPHLLNDSPEEPSTTTSTLPTTTSDAAWNPRHNFTADSPYFKSFCDHEIQSLSLLTDAMREITTRTKTLCQTGALMGEATRRLASSCRLRWDEEQSREDGMTPEEIDQLVAARRKAVGGEMAELLEHLGKALDEVAFYQIAMLQSIESTLGMSFEAFAASELKTVSILKSDADEATEAAELQFGKYLNGKNNFSESFGEKAAGKTAAGERLGKAFKNWNLGRGGHDAATSNPGDSRIEKAMEASNLVSSLEQVRVLQGMAELRRFQLMKHLISIKHRRNFEVAENAISTLHEISNYHGRCKTAVDALSPSIKEIQERQNKLREEHASTIVPTWQGRETALRDAVHSIRIKATEASKAAAAIADGDAKEIERQLLKVDDIEEQVQLWNLPHALAATSRYQRDTMPGVKIEGWLYKKNTSLMALQAWQRRWFVMDNDAIYYFSADGDDRPYRRKGAYSSRVKVCDVVLCTVRELPVEGQGPRFCFQLVTPSEKPLTLQAPGPIDYKIWVDGIRSAMEHRLYHGDPNAPHLNQNLGRKPINSGNTRESSFSELPPTEVREVSDTSPEMETNPLGPPQNASPLVEKIMNLNPTCADCGMASPDWASLNLGILVCIECSGVHRSLGIHVSRVRSLKLDSISLAEGGVICLLGNDKVNPIWEEGLAAQTGWQKPTENADRKGREAWIKSKYQWKGFLQYEGCEGLTDEEKVEKYSKALYDAAKKCDLVAAAGSLARGGSPDWTNPDEGGRTPLHACALVPVPEGDEEWHAIEMAEFLLQNGGKL
ncbi:Arf-GAP with coiled-coil, ANK repeat and PH domain-containing protein [Fistulifera solaris]|uniref:Arf-GAP with coiled-coil, ANK repeat and PH domain-containing protein n=1 Tax=Fistulifera solaris TaxID=1519565 RepID=A0A1Z5K5Y5_FISSO|nr:Arf-GAP with coiled-coil, ANK repeat and PH domain-containing protein [Fistulifera solaris]|eukprot:GAX21703.1 Arf-GAP with coiled-coil, ANK repeat and PH domain-containing protein [Fistulifera solaris]